MATGTLQRCSSCGEEAEPYAGSAKCRPCHGAQVMASPNRKASNLAAVRRYRERQRTGESAPKRERVAVPDPDKKAARTALNHAVRDGKVTRPDRCERCQKVGRVHGHHSDYAKPLDVDWLCPYCHADEHGGQ